MMSSLVLSAAETPPGTIDGRIPCSKILSCQPVLLQLGLQEGLEKVSHALVELSEAVMPRTRPTPSEERVLGTAVTSRPFSNMP